MRILHISTFDIKGGAAIAAYRLHKGLLQAGEDSQMLVHYKLSKDETVYGFSTSKISGACNSLKLKFDIIQKEYIETNSTEFMNTIFSIGYPGIDLSELEITRSADVVNLHWVDNFQSPYTLMKLFSMKKPIVWTLHDQWPFTGGCHYSSGCQGYKSNCRNCFQLRHDPYFLPNVLLKDKVKLFESSELSIVSPSRWLAECASKSALFKENEINVIPYSVPFDQYFPQDKVVSKIRIGIPKDSVTLVFGADDINEKRKGYSKLIEALKFCYEDNVFKRLMDCGKLNAISFGAHNYENNDLPINIKNLGFVDSGVLIRDAYSAGDIFVLPSLEDNLPNTILEAMACGIPVVAYNTGGIPEIVSNGKTGILIPKNSIKELGSAIKELVLDDQKRKIMGELSRNIIKNYFSAEIQVKQYQKVYNRAKKFYQYNNLCGKKFTSDSLCTEEFKDLTNQISEYCMYNFITRNYHDIEESTKNYNNLKNNFESIKRSLSWRITKPLRSVGKYLDSIFSPK